MGLTFTLRRKRAKIYSLPLPSPSAVSISRNVTAGNAKHEQCVVASCARINSQTHTKNDNMHGQRRPPRNFTRAFNLKIIVLTSCTLAQRGDTFFKLFNQRTRRNSDAATEINSRRCSLPLTRVICLSTSTLFETLSSPEWLLSFCVLSRNCAPVFCIFPATAFPIACISVQSVKVTRLNWFTKWKYKKRTRFFTKMISIQFLVFSTQLKK